MNVTTIQASGPSAMCPTGKFALGGGGSTTNAGSYLTSTIPVVDASGRAIGWSVAQSAGGNTGLASYVICADVAAAGGPPPQGVTVIPAWSANEDNTVSVAVPGNGQHTYTFQLTGLQAGTFNFATISSGNVVQNADGTYAFCDFDGNRKADGVGASNAFITQINGSFLTPPTNLARFVQTTGNQTITVTIDSATRNQRVRVVGWRDGNGDGQIDLAAAGDVNCDNPSPYDSTTDGGIAVSGRKFYFGPEGQFGAQFPDPNGIATCQPAFRHDAANQTFSAGPSSATSLRYGYDSGDSFRILGTAVTFDQFKSSLTAFSDGSADTVQINYVPGGTSEFNICSNAGFRAPNNLSAELGDFDGGLSANDVKLTLTAPSSNTTSSYSVQRASLGSAVVATAANCNLNAQAPASTDATGAPAGASFVAIGTANVLSFETGSFVDHNVANGGYCYRVVVVDTILGTNSYSNYVPVNVAAAAAPSLTVTPDAAVNVDNTVSPTVPGTGQHTFNFHASNLSGNLSFSVLQSVNTNQNADGTSGFCDTNGDHKADLGSGTFIVSINGLPYPPTNTVLGVPIPSSGNLDVVIDSATRNQRVRVVGWQDSTGDGQIDLVAAGDSFCDAFTNYDSGHDGLLALSGRKYYFGADAAAGTYACAPAWRHDAVNQVLSIGPTSATSQRFNYDAGDTFHVLGALVTLDQFKSSITAFSGGDTISVTYAPGGSSDFNICTNVGSLAPTDLSASVGNFDTGTALDDVHLAFTTPGANQINSYKIERSYLGASTTATSTNCNLNAPAASTSDTTGVPAGSTFTTEGIVTKSPGQPAAFTDGDLAPGGYCYRVRTEDPIFPVSSFSNYAPANIASPLPPPGAISASPDYSVSEDNTVSTTVPGTGQHNYTFTTALTGTLSFAVISSANVVRNADTSFSFCDADQNSQADGVGAGSTLITQVNGVPIAPNRVALNQVIPGNGAITVTIDSSTRNQRIRVVAWQDLNNNGQIDLAGAGDINCDFPQQYGSANDGGLTISGRKFYFGPEGSFGPQFQDISGNPQCEPVFRHDGATQTFSAGPVSSQSLRYSYDSGDIFRVIGSLVTLDQFKNSLTGSISGIADTIKINYAPGGTSAFDICTNAGASAPSNVSAATLNADGGTSANDVRLTFTTPVTNLVTTFTIQRASLFAVASQGNCNLGATPPSSDVFGTPTGGVFGTVGTAGTLSGGEQATFTDFNLANGGYCYRVRAQDPLFGTFSYSNYVPVNIPGSADTSPPVSTLATETAIGGLTSVLDQGDRLVFDFADVGCVGCSISVATNAAIHVADSDCGPATNAGPAACAGGNTNTFADIVCGTNAVCTLQAGPNGPNTELVVNISANPTISTPGSVPGVQLPVVVTDSSGITDLSGNQWNVLASVDRVVEPVALTGGPTSITARLSTSAGFANMLDQGDALTLDFDRTMFFFGTGVIRLTDSDCGSPTNSGPAQCTGGNTNTVGDIICGTNATCGFQTGPGGTNSELIVTMIGNPAIVAAGSLSGAQLTLFITDSSGIGNSTAGPWNLPGSQDRLIEPASASGGPISTSAILTSSGGFATILDAGDNVTIDFNVAVSLAGNAVIRVTDSDCGPATNAGPFPFCSGGNTNTVADVVCGSNATCTLQNGPNGVSTEVVVHMTGNPSIVTPGSTSGAQYPVVVTDSVGIGAGGNAWDLAASTDRLFGPAGN